MTAVNQFEQFATGGAANTLTPAAYAALTSLLLNGYQTGTASSQQINTTLRQSAFIAAMIGQFIANETGNNANDDNNMSVLLANFILGVQNSLTTNINGWTAGQRGIFVPVQSVALSATLTLDFGLGNNFVVGAGAGGINPIAANFALGTPSRVLPGQSGIITFVQDGTGGHTLSSRTTSWVGANGLRVNLTAGANGRDDFFYVVDYDSKIILSAAGNVS